ncbi:MAG: ABC transporter ATP-binding protein [Cytophagales bacterium]|nr:MAG: ABC transporter ATP-binding protein [Cytophagales bacterium]
MLSAKNIKKSYGNLEVLKGIDLEIQKGEIVSIIGASGAGKSTLLQILGTLDSPDIGSLTINNTSIEKLNKNGLAQFRNLNLGFIFQFHNLLPEFSALENVCIPGFLANQNQKNVQSRAKELLEKLHLSHRMNHRPSELSGGEQQRVSVARALMNRPAIIFADEPTGNLDSKNASELHQLFFQLREELHQTFVIVTHNESLAKSADRCLSMKDGLWE